MTDILSRGVFSTPVDRKAVATNWRGRGYSCSEFADPPGRAWRDFVHDCNELVTVVEGRLELDVAGERVVAGPGDEVFIPKDARHSVFNVNDATTVWLFGYD